MRSVLARAAADGSAWVAQRRLHSLDLDLDLDLDLALGTAWPPAA